MTEPVFGLTSGAANLVREMADKHRQRLPDAGRRTRRVSPRGATSKIVVIQANVGPGKAGTGRVQKITNTPPIEDGDDVTIDDVDPVIDIVVLNFRPNWLGSGIAYIAHPVGNHWVVENDACFQDFMS